jgi:hypothetical protein
MNIQSATFWGRLSDAAFNLATVSVVATIVSLIAASVSKSGAMPALQPAEIALPIAACFGFSAATLGGIASHIEQKLLQVS